MTLAIRINPVMSKSQPRAKYPRYAEIVNMRSAMAGVTTGIGNEIITGKGIMEQLHDPGCALAASMAVALVATGSTITFNERMRDDYDNQGPFTPEVEEINGRLAMLGALGIAVMPFLV